MKYHSLGSLIRAHRTRLGLTQLQLAEKLHITDKAVSKWERGLSSPDIQSLPQLAKLFDISVDELTTLQKPDSEQAGTSSVHPRVRRLVFTLLVAIGLAMGVATAVLGILGDLDPQDAPTLLGIGLACVSAALLSRIEKSK